MFRNQAALARGFVALALVGAVSTIAHAQQAAVPSLVFEGVTVVDEREVLALDRRWRCRPQRSGHREANFGELMQLEGSFYDWFDGRGPRACVMMLIDDATGTTLLRFGTEETTWARAIPTGVCYRDYAHQPRHDTSALITDRCWRGTPMPFIPPTLGSATSRATLRYAHPTAEMMHHDYSISSSSLHLGFIAALLVPEEPVSAGANVRRVAAGRAGAVAVWAHVREAGDHADRGVESATKRPRGAGYGTYQDRLIKKMRLVSLADVTAANAYVEQTYLPEHNRRFARVPSEGTFLRPQVRPSRRFVNQ